MKEAINSELLFKGLILSKAEKKEILKAFHKIRTT